MHGCINDCLCSAAEEDADELAQRVEKLLAEETWLRYHDTPMFKVDKYTTKKGDEVAMLGSAPEFLHTWKCTQPRLSVWSTNTWDNDPLVQGSREELPES